MVHTGLCVVLQVVLKIIQHCEQEGGGAEAVQGNLLGLVDEGNKRVEITNCFPTPQRGDEEEEDSGQRKMDRRRDRHTDI